MYIDKSLVLSDAQAITTTGASTNYIDTLAAGQAYAEGAWFIALVKTAYVGNVTVQFELQTATDTAFTSPVTLLSSGAVAVATLVAGYFAVKARIPVTALRYLRGYATLVGGSYSAGAVDMKIVEDVDVNLP